MTETDTGIFARAQAALGPAVVNSRGPAKIVAAALAGTTDGITFESNLRYAHQIMALRDSAGPGAMAFAGPGATFSVEVTLFPGWSYYVEVNGGTNPPDRPLLWSALVERVGSSRGTATHDPQTGHWYFATPMADDRPTGTINLYIDVDDGNTEQGFGMEWVTLLAVKLDGAAGDG